MPERRVVVVGAGIVGLNVALALRRRGCAVTVLDARGPGLATSYGNAGCIAVAEITPISMPGLIRQVPRMLLDPLGPLAIRWRYLPRLLPWLWRFLRARPPAPGGGPAQGRGARGGGARAHREGGAPA